MKKLVDRVWDSICAGINVIRMNDSSIKSDDLNKKKKVFEDNFHLLYDKINRDYMTSDTETLDRHKVASIIMVSIIKSNILTTQTTIPADKHFMGNYILATDCGFAYMLKELNEKLRNLGQKEIRNFFFPDAMACKTSYYRIFFRNLYFANNDSDWNLNPLDIAERLFLLEYMTLKEEGINPNILNEYE